MGVPLLEDFDLAVPKPIDSRMVFTGLFLTSVPNRYEGMLIYSSGDKNLFLDNRRTAPQIFERVLTTTVISNNNEITGNFGFAGANNGQALYVSGNNNLTGSLPTTALGFGSGYNVTIIQMGNGNIVFNDSINLKFRNRIGANRTAGKYAVASILRIGTTNDFLLYGDIV